MDGAHTTPGFLHLHSLAEDTEWLHMCIKHEETSAYLMDVAMLDDLIVDAMIEEDTRSRIRVHEDGIMVLLKAMHVECEDMARPEDMVSIRVWIDPKRVITTREADVDPILALASRIEKGTGPTSPGAFLSDLIDEHLNEVSDHIEWLEDAVNTTEEMVAHHENEAACPKMSDIQTRISGFLRHLGPQNPVLERLCKCEHNVLSTRDRARLDDALNKLLRYLETLHSLRERTDILNDQLSRIQDRQLNKSSFAFAVAATLFLPLGFVTGLFGINVMGIPLAEHPHGFAIMAGVCVAVLVAILAILRGMKWL